MPWWAIALIVIAVFLFFGALGRIDNHLETIAGELSRLRRLYDPD